MTKNLCGKTVSRENAYEVWQTLDKQWTWYVLKKYQSEENEKKNEYARWFVSVDSPFTTNELGDSYAKDIINYSRRIK